MFCMKCGTKLPDSANFCFNCGMQLKDTENISINHSNLKLGNEEILFKSTGSVGSQGLLAEGNIIITNKNLKFEKNQAVTTISLKEDIFSDVDYFIDSFYIPLNKISSLTRSYCAEKFTITSNNKTFLYTVEDTKFDFPAKLYELIKNNKIFKENLPKDYHFAPREIIKLSSQATIIKERGIDEPVKMILTNNRILFFDSSNFSSIVPGEYRVFSYNQYKYEIPLEEITDINPQLERINTPLTIEIKDGTIYKFLTSKKKVWKEEIDKAITNLKENR